MKAVVYTEYGSPDVLHLAEVPKPAPKDNEILIKIHARGVDFGDLMARNFGNITRREFNMPTPLLPLSRLIFGWNRPKNPILGAELSGTVEAVGSAVTRFKPGDEVFAYPGQKMGAYAEYLCMRETATIAHKPANMTFEEAAAVPYGALMALNLFRKLAVRPGHKVLIVGASGGIGSYAVQLAKHHGAEVTGVCSTPRVDLVQALGADHVIDYTQQDFTRTSQTYDFIIDILGRSSFARCKKVLAQDGRYVRVSFKMRHLFQMLRTSLFGRKKVVCALLSDSAQDLTAVKELVEAGKIKVIIDRCFPLEQTADAHRYVEAGNRTGQVVITSSESGTNETLTLER